ncbi:MAG: N-6 DNA methylase, partial [Sideroxyarcus sp.]|nr:N-6 DNA methylase [Sideroxyarcus sp.]
MALSWNEIRNRAHEFSKRWENETSEDAEAKAFWIEFLNVFGIDRKRVASFEEPVKKLGDKQGYIDLFWKGMLLVEHKSRGKDLDKAYTQALDYFPGIKERDLPKYVLVSDFARFRLYDLEAEPSPIGVTSDLPARGLSRLASSSTRGQGGGAFQEFNLKDLHKNIKLFAFIAGYQTRPIKPEDPVNIKAAELMGKLHDALKDIGYAGHALEHYLVRLLFCLFAEDTGIFERQQLKEYIQDKTAEDGSDLAAHLAQLFEVLNTPKDKRLKNLDEHLAAFEYVNGKLFAEHLPTASFDAKMRNQLLDCCALDWSRVSPAIFGSLFQSVMDDKLRRNIGAHYTSEANILKLIKPLFLDKLHSEFESCKSNAKKLTEFHDKLRKLKFFDPACGCGNFLVIAYRELRLLELKVLRSILAAQRGQGFVDVSGLVWLDVDQFYGIEIEEFPAQIAQVAMWLTDHQMNQLISEEFGNYFARLPLKKSATIVCGNSLQLDWGEVAPNVDYILGNPPFVGKKEQNVSQKIDMEQIFHSVKGAGVLDYVAAWYLKAAQYMTSVRP